MNILTRIAISAFVITVYAPILSAADDENFNAKKAYDLGAFPYLSSYQMIDAYGPIAKKLSKIMGKPVRLRSAANFEKFGQNLQHEIYDIAVIQPFDYLNATEKYHYYPLVRVDEPLITTFVVRQDSPLKSLGELKDKKLAFPPKPSANARMARAELAKFGLIPGKNVFVTYHNSHDSCMHDVLIGRAVTCPSGGPAIKLFEEKRHVKLKILATTSAIPHVSIVAHQRIPSEERENLQRWFSSLGTTPSGREILKGLHFPGFIKATDDDYIVLRAYDTPSTQTANTRESDATHNNASRKKILTLGIFPYVNPKQLAKLIAPIPTDLSNALGNQEVRFKTTADYSKFVDNLEQGNYDIVLVQPFDVAIALRAGYVPMAQMSGGIKAAIYTKSLKSITSLDELKHKTIAAPPRESAVSRLLLAELQKKELEIGRDITIVFRRTHYSCLEQLQRDFVDACVTTSTLVDNMVDSQLKKNVHKIFETKAIPGLMFLAKNSLNSEQVSIIRQAMLNWENSVDGQNLLKQAGFSQFIPVDIAQYQKLRDQFK